MDQENSREKYIWNVDYVILKCSLISGQFCSFRGSAYFKEDGNRRGYEDLDLLMEEKEKEMKQKEELDKARIEMVLNSFKRSSVEVGLKKTI